MHDCQELGDHPERDWQGQQDSRTGSLTSRRQDMSEEVISASIVKEACLTRPQAEQAAGEREMDSLQLYPNYPVQVTSLLQLSMTISGRSL